MIRNCTPVPLALSAKFSTSVAKVSNSCGTELSLSVINLRIFGTSRSMLSAISLADIPSPVGILTGVSSLSGGETNPGFLPGLAGGGGLGRFPPGAGLFGVRGPLLDGCLGGNPGPEVFLAGGSTGPPSVPFLSPLEGGCGLSGTSGLLRVDELDVLLLGGALIGGGTLALGRADPRLGRGGFCCCGGEVPLLLAGGGDSLFVLLLGLPVMPLPDRLGRGGMGGN